MTPLLRNTILVLCAQGVLMTTIVLGFCVWELLANKESHQPDCILNVGLSIVDSVNDEFKKIVSSLQTGERYRSIFASVCYPRMVREFCKVSSKTVNYNPECLFVRHFGLKGGALIRPAVWPLPYMRDLYFTMVLLVALLFNVAVMKISPVVKKSQVRVLKKVRSGGKSVPSLYKMAYRKLYLRLLSRILKGEVCIANILEQAVEKGYLNDILAGQSVSYAHGSDGLLYMTTAIIIDALKAGDPFFVKHFNHIKE